MRKPVIIATAVLAIAAVIVVFVVRGRGETAESYRFVEISRGDIESTVGATGALEAVRTVQVGTQVSGQIVEILVDFNDRVRKGQLIARLDRTLLQQAVRDADAALERSRSEAELRDYALRQAAQLFASRVITETEYRTAEFNAKSAAAALSSALAGVERARTNLSYANIYSPVNGVVIARNVDVGQTVASSLSAPTLFVIAEDLGKLQIMASVAESDIGQIREGMETRFTVQAYPGQTFSGSVRQVRMQSATQENVVSYTVAVDVANPDGKLLPGMTATVSFLIDAVRSALRVPNAALRFRPSDALLARAKRDTVMPADTGGRRTVPVVPRRTATAQDTARRATTSLRRGELWYIGPDGIPASKLVRLGLTDGSFTQVVAATGVTEGMQVIAGVLDAGGSGSTGTNPFQTNQRQGGPGRPPGP